MPKELGPYELTTVQLIDKVAHIKKIIAKFNANPELAWHDDIFRSYKTIDESMTALLQLEQPVKQGHIGAVTELLEHLNTIKPYLEFIENNRHLCCDLEIDAVEAAVPALDPDAPAFKPSWT